MDYKIIDIEGIGPIYAEKLENVGIKTVKDLLEKGKNAKGRRDLAETTGISGKRILTWVNHADLLRIEEIDPDCAELLEASGVDTVTELALRNPANLLKKMETVNESKHLAPSVPSLEELKEMIAKAKTLPRMLTYGRVKAKTEKPVKREKKVEKNEECKTVNIYDDDVRLNDFAQYQDGKWGLKDQNGNWVSVNSMHYDYENETLPMVSKFDDLDEWWGLVMLKEGDEWGIMGSDGEWICSNFGGFEDEGYPYLTGWQDGDEFHIYSDGRVLFAFEDEDDEEGWDYEE